MAKYILYNKEGSAVIDKQSNEIIVSGIEYSGKWMGECFVTVTIKSAYPIDFNIGDYLIYRDEKFELKTVPTVNKKARTGTYGEGYVYDNIKLYSLTNETTDVMFHDQVLYDNNVHYSSLPNFSFYCETIDDLADRLQANMNRYCENNGYEDIDFWLFFTPNKNRTIQRARSVSETFAQNASLKWDTYFNLGTETSEEKTKLSLSCSSQTVWEACQLIKTSFGLNFIAKNRNIVIGAAGLPTNHLFKYGKDNGLYEIYRTVDSAQKVTTRVFAYGSDKNMPNHYYQDMETLPNNMALQVLMLPGFPKLSLNDICKATYNSVSNTTTFSIRKNKTSEYSDFLTVEGKHIPVFSSDPLKPYIDSGNASELGIHEGDVSFTEENDDNGLKSIYPSIEGMTAGDVFGTTSTDRLDEILSADIITDNGIFDDGATIPNFKVRLKNIGFDLQSAMLSSGQMTIGFTDGYCGGREFKVQSCITELDGTNTLTLERVEDNGVYFPCAWNNEAQSGYPYQISAGDHFYLTGININDTNYIYAATIKLLRKTLLWLFNNDHVRYTYQPKIDEIYMARQHEIAINNDNVISLHDTIKEGDLLLFSDDDLGISGSVYIDQLVIKEDGNNGIPTYEVTLRNDVSVGTLQRIQNQIDSLTYAANGVKSNIAGYTNSTQVKRIIEAYGGDLFVSKVQDDTAQGFITFLKGLQVGDGSAKIDKHGNTEINSIAVRQNSKLGSNGSRTEFGEEKAGVIYVDENGVSHVEFDYLTIRRAASFREITIKELKHIGGELCLTAAAMECSDVEEVDNGYKCYFETTDGEKTVFQEFVVGDQARCQQYSFSRNSAGYYTTKFYWRKVIEVGDNYIILSKSDCAANSNIPEKNDKIVQLGYDEVVGGTDNPYRKSAIILSATATDAPSAKYYQGINDYSLNHLVKDEGFDPTTGEYHQYIYGETFIGNDNTFIKFTKTGGIEIKANIDISNSDYGNQKVADIFYNLTKGQNDTQRIATDAQNLVNQLAGDVSDAKADANEAKAQATLAKTTSDGYGEQIGIIEQKAEDAIAAAEDAQTGANDAKDKADEAAVNAESAARSAGEAAVSANNANQKAIEASSAADVAQTSAEQAMRDAGNASSKADAAQTSADTARESAESAKEAADTATEKAGEAAENAQAAAEVAADAKKDAIDAKNSANSANTTAGEAKELASEAKQESANALQKAIDSLNGVENIAMGVENLITNGGFTGIFTSESINEAEELHPDTAIYSDKFGKWDIHDGCEAVASVYGHSGIACKITNGELKQKVYGGVLGGKPYIVSFMCADFGEVTISVGSFGKQVLCREGKREVIKFVAQENSEYLDIQGTATITDVMVLQSNININDWIPSPFDNNKYLGYFKNIAYLSSAMNNANTDILGGLILSQMIRVGNFKDKELKEETGGMSGLMTSYDSPFLWCGGTMEQAFDTIAKYAANPLYKATDEEVASMAKFVVTHGGKAILNDIILRGYIYAKGGLFENGIFKNVSSANGSWSIDEDGNTKTTGDIFTPYTIINNENKENYGYYAGNKFVLDLKKSGYNIQIEGVFGTSPYLYLELPTDVEIGANLHIFNNSWNIQYKTGMTIMASNINISSHEVNWEAKDISIHKGCELVLKSCMIGNEICWIYQNAINKEVKTEMINTPSIISLIAGETRNGEITQPKENMPRYYHDYSFTVSKVGTGLYKFNDDDDQFGLEETQIIAHVNDSDINHSWNAEIINGNNNGYFVVKTKCDGRITDLSGRQVMVTLIKTTQNVLGFSLSEEAIF